MPIFVLEAPGHANQKSGSLQSIQQSSFKSGSPLPLVPSPGLESFCLPGFAMNSAGLQPM